MADTESIDIMESVFGNIVLPDVQVQTHDNHSEHLSRRSSHHSEHRLSRRSSHHSGHHSHRSESIHEPLAQPPVPKQRHELSSGHSTLKSVSVLEKEPEFRASFLNSQPDEELEIFEHNANNHERQHSIGSHNEHHSHREHHDAASHKSASVHSKSRCESTLSHKSDDHVYDEVHADIGEPVMEAPVEINNQPRIEPDRISNSSKLPKRSSNTDQLIAELRSRQNNEAGYDHGTISTSKTSEIANEYELYTTPVPDSEGTLNEQTDDDSGTEVEEVLPVNRTKYLFDSKDPYLVEHDKHPDNFQQELGQKVTVYKPAEPTDLQNAHASDTLRSNASEKSSASDFIVSIFENKTQDRVRGEIGSQIKLNNLKEKFEHPAENGHLHSEHHSHSSNKHSYKQFIGKKSPEPRVLRSGSIASMTVFGLENVVNEAPKKMPTLIEDEEPNFQESQQYFQHRQAFTPPHTIQAPPRRILVQKRHSSQLNGHSNTHQNEHPVHAKTPNESRRSTLIDHSTVIKPPVVHAHEEEHQYDTVYDSRRPTVIEQEKSSRRSSQHQIHAHPVHGHLNHHESHIHPVHGHSNHHESHIHHIHHELVPHETHQARVADLIHSFSAHQGKTNGHHVHTHGHHLHKESEHGSHRPTLIEQVHLHPVHPIESSKHTTPHQSRRSTLVHPVEHTNGHTNGHVNGHVNEHHLHKTSEHGSRRSTLIEHVHSHPVEQQSFALEYHLNGNSKHTTPHQSRRSTFVEHSKPQEAHHENDLNNNDVEADNVAKLCTVFEKGHQMHHKAKHIHSAPVSPAPRHHFGGFQVMEKYHVPLLSRVVINDEIAHGRGSCTPGSISALHKTILVGNANVRPRSITPVSYVSIVEDEHEHASSPTPSETHAPQIRKGRKPKTLAAFYKKWGNATPSVTSEI